MDRCRADLNGDDGVERRDGGLEGLELEVLIGEDTELACERGEVVSNSLMHFFFDTKIATKSQELRDRGNVNRRNSG